ncbi:MAG: cytochrome P450, partial [Deltaproteobacteria bacterium]|nr:cytochrome P450 [Deltaproteobacteria bacterium]
MASIANALVSPPPPVMSVPALAGLPVLGNLLDFRRDRLALQDRAVKLAPLTRVSLIHIPLYVSADADLAHRVLVEDAASYQKSAGLLYLMPLLGEGLLTSEGATHKRHRKLLAPAFAPKRLAAYGDTMVAETTEQMSRWKAGTEIDLSREMMELTLAIAGKTMFNADVRSDAAAVAGGLELAMQAMVANLTS